MVYCKLQFGYKNQVNSQVFVFINLFVHSCFFYLGQQNEQNSGTPLFLIWSSRKKRSGMKRHLANQIENMVLSEIGSGFEGLLLESLKTCQIPPVSLPKM